MRSIYQRQFVLMAGMILISFALLGASFIILSYNYTVREEQDSIQRNAAYVAQVLEESVSSDMDQQGFVLKASRVQPTLESVAVVTDATVLMATQEGQILFAVDGTGEISDLTDVQIPMGVIQTIQTSGSYGGMTTLGNTFGERRYVAGVPFLYTYRGNTMIAGIALVAGEASSLGER